MDGDAVKILIVKTSSLGDIIHAFPVVDWIKEHLPESQIDWIVEKSCSDLIRRHPAIHKVIEVDMRKWRHALFSGTTWREIADAKRAIRAVRYDVAFDLQGNIKSGMILSYAAADHKIGFGKKNVAEWPNRLFTTEKFDPPAGNNIREDYLYLVQKHFEGICTEVKRKASSVKLMVTPEEIEAVNKILDTSKKNFLICPGANWENKRLSLETLREVMKLIHKQYPHALCLYAWGTDSEKDICRLLHEEEPNRSALIPKLNLPTLQYLMSKVDRILAMDSLPLHLAGTTGTPTVGIFGPSLAKKYAPIGAQHQVLQGSCPYGRSFEKRCPILRSCPTGFCIKDLKAEEVIHLFQEDLDDLL